MSVERLAQCTGFQWDAGNDTKNWEKHNVSNAECEQVLLNRPLVAGMDDLHSLSENRYWLLGKTDSARLLFVVVTIRGELIRVISARDMNRAERSTYAQEEAS